MAAGAAELVGRDEELTAIAEFLEAGAPACAVGIEGEAGIGKTTVWHAAVEAAAAGGRRALRARPAESEAKLAFSSLADLLGDAIDDALGHLPPPQRRALEVALLIEDAGGARADRRAVAAGLLSSLRALASETPLLLAIDDVQWVDRSSAAALEFALRRLRDEPVALLVTRRLNDLDGDQRLERTLPSERLLLVPLGPFEFVAPNTLLHERLATVLSRPLLHRIHELSGGNPFFALELARAPERVEPGRGLPPTLDVLVQGRIGTLPEEARRALLAASALSEPTVELVERVAGRHALAPAEAAHVVLVERGHVHFEHPLVASAAYAAAEPAERREVHRALAGLWAEPEERARHLAASATGPDEEIAAALAEEAGDEGTLALALGSQLLAEATVGRVEAAETLEAALAYQSAVGNE